MCVDNHLLFATADHVSYDESESMATECHENSRFVKNAPHFISDLIDHVLPSFGTGIVVRVLE